MLLINESILLPY